MNTCTVPGLSVLYVESAAGRHLPQPPSPCAEQSVKPAAWLVVGNLALAQGGHSDVVFASHVCRPMSESPAPLALCEEATASGMCYRINTSGERRAVRRGNTAGH